MPDPTGSIHKDAVLAARRAGGDPRPALLRLLVARYTARRGHSAAEQQRFAGLAIRLLGVVDPATARRVVSELSTAPELPYTLALHLARGPIALAAPVLRFSPVLDDVTLMALLDTTSPAHAAAMSARREVSSLLAKKLASVLHEARGTSSAGERPAGTDALPADVAPGARTGAGLPFHATPAGFSAATARQRAELFDQLALLPALPMGARLPRAADAMVGKLELAAMRHQPDVLATLLAKMLGVQAETAAALLRDESGEALVVAGRALGMAFDSVGRLILLVHPALGRSVTRVFGLAELFEHLGEMSAQHLVAAWRGGPWNAGARRAQTARPEEMPSMRGFGQTRRRTDGALSETGERNRRGLGVAD